MFSIKEVLRRIPPVYSLHVALHSRATVYRYRRLSQAYDAYDLMVAPKLAPVLLPSKPHIFFMGTDEFQDRGGTIQALESLADVTLFTRADGSYGQNDPDTNNRANNNSKRLRELFDGLANQKRIPDLLITQSWADYIKPECLIELRQKYGTLMINIGMDDRHRWEAVKPLIPVLDLALTAAPECVEWYKKEGCPAIFFPEASSPEIFHPMPDEPKIYDVSFIGARYGIREKIVHALLDEGINVAAFGSGWEGGRVPVEDVPRIFARSKIVLGIGTIAHCTNFYALKMRDFDGPMSGSLYLTHDNTDLQSLYKVGKEIVTYRNVQECVEKAKHLIANNDERENIARRGYERALAEHTWLHRFQELLNSLRGDA